MNQELYDAIYGSFIETITAETAEERLFLHELTLRAVKGVEQYQQETEEAIGHLRDTIKRLSKDG